MLEVFNPYNNELVGSVKSCNIKDIDEAVEKLRTYNFDLGAYERSLILNKAVELLKEEQHEFVELISSEIGVSKKDAIHEVERSFNVISLCSEEA